MVAADAGAVVRQRFLGVTGILQRVGQTRTVVGARRAFEIIARFAQRAAGVDDRRDRAHRLAADARMAHLGQVLGEEVDHAAEEWKAEQHEQPVVGAAIANRMHGEKNCHQDVKRTQSHRHGALLSKLFENSRRECVAHRPEFS